MDDKQDIEYQIFKMSLHTNYFIHVLKKFKENCKFINKDLCENLHEITEEIEKLIDNEPPYVFGDKNISKYSRDDNVVICSFSSEFYCTICNKKFDSEHLEYHINCASYRSNRIRKQNEDDLTDYELQYHEFKENTIKDNDDEQFCNEKIEQNDDEDLKHKTENNINDNFTDSNDNIQVQEIQEDVEKYVNLKCYIQYMKKKKEFEEERQKIKKENKLFKRNCIKIIERKIIYCNVCKVVITAQLEHAKSIKHLINSSNEEFQNFYEAQYFSTSLETIYICQLCKLKFSKKNYVLNHIHERSHNREKYEWKNIKKKPTLLWNDEILNSCINGDDNYTYQSY